MACGYGQRSMTGDWSLGPGYSLREFRDDGFCNSFVLNINLEMGPTVKPWGALNQDVVS